MSIDETKLNNDITSKLCNVMVNCQELSEDLEDLEEIELYKKNLKMTAKKLSRLCMENVNDIFGVGQKDVIDAIRKKKSDKDVDKIRSKAKIKNEAMIHVYENAMKSRIEYSELTFDERLAVLKILKDVREGNVKYVGEELYYKIEGGKN